MTPDYETKTTIHLDFTFPESRRADIEEILEKCRDIGNSLVEQLSGAGLPEEHANTLAMQFMAQKTCDLSMNTVDDCVRCPPSRERWLAMMGEVFDRTLAAHQTAVTLVAELRHG